MKTSDVLKLSPIERFCYWVNERHQIFLRRRAGLPRPWTDDEVLQNYFFTNPYRENDKTTVWFRKNVREPLRESPDVIMATVIFRWFNYIPTGRELLKSVFNRGEIDVSRSLLTYWNTRLALAVLGHIRDMGGQVFTGAFMINSPGGEPKLEAICRRIQNVWDARVFLQEDFWRASKDKPSMEYAHGLLTKFEGLGGFMAYEVVCDLRYTCFLERAPDRMTWCNPGPGAVRGICRILDIDFEKGRNAHGFTPKVPINVVDEIRKLLKTTQKRMPKMPPFEMREIEHSLCEYDKYCRALYKDGRMKRLYKGRG